MNPDFFNPKNQIYCFSLGGRMCNSIVWRLRYTDCSYQLRSNNIDHYLGMLLHDQPGYILGIGSYSRNNQDKILIETRCSNKLDKIAITPFLKPTDNFKYSEGIGSSSCNTASWHIMTKIKSGELTSQYTFLHLPQSMKMWEALRTIDRALEDFKHSLKKT